MTGNGSNLNDVRIPVAIGCKADWNKLCTTPDRSREIVLMSAPAAETARVSSGTSLVEVDNVSRTYHKGGGNDRIAARPIGQRQVDAAADHRRPHASQQRRGAD
jgi:hypothetical protein